MKHIVLTSDSGICALKKDNTVVIPAQVVCSNRNVFKDDRQRNNKKL